MEEEELLFDIGDMRILMMIRLIMGIFRCLFFLFVVITTYSSAFAEEYVVNDITNTDKYKEYENYARQLKRDTDSRLNFNKKSVNKNNTTTDIDTLLNSSLPNWKNLNTSTPVIQNMSIGISNGNNDIGSIPLVFISFSMPEELIRNYIIEARLYGGVLVLRGLIGNSLKQTVMKLKEIEEINHNKTENTKNNKSNLSIVIHPHLFKLYDIKQVPAIVISKDNLGCVLKYDDCSILYEYDKIYGSVSVEYALDEVRKNGSSEGLKKIAREVLNNHSSNNRKKNI